MTTEEDMGEIDEIPANQTVEVGSVWDMRNAPEPSPGLFEVKNIHDGIASDSENDDEGFSIGIDELANYYLKLTPGQAKRIRYEMREFHKSTIQPIKGPNGKVIQVGSTWDIKKPDADNDFSCGRFTVYSTSPPSNGDSGTVWAGEEMSGFGKNASEIFKYGTEVPLDKLPEYFSEHSKKRLEREIKKYLDEGKNVRVKREFNNGKLEKYEIVESQKTDKEPEVIFEDRELSAEEKAENEKNYKGFLEWVAAERALAAERSPELHVLKKNEIKLPIISMSKIEEIPESANKEHHNLKFKERMRS